MLYKTASIARASSSCTARVAYITNPLNGTIRSPLAFPFGAHSPALSRCLTANAKSKGGTRCNRRASLPLSDRAHEPSREEWFEIHIRAHTRSPFRVRCVQQRIAYITCRTYCAVLCYGACMWLLRCCNRWVVATLPLSISRELYGSQCRAHKQVRVENRPSVCFSSRTEAAAHTAALHFIAASQAQKKNCDFVVVVISLQHQGIEHKERLASSNQAKFCHCQWAYRVLFWVYFSFVCQTKKKQIIRTFIFVICCVCLYLLVLHIFSIHLNFGAEIFLSLFFVSFFLCEIASACATTRLFSISSQKTYSVWKMDIFFLLCAVCYVCLFIK